MDDIKKIQNQIKELREKKKQVEIEYKIQKKQIRNERKNNQNGNKNANTLRRVSNEFAKKMDSINNKREQNGFDRISNPKITNLIIKHKDCWQQIERDIVGFNTLENGYE